MYKRQDELTARLSRAEESAKNISEARAQAEKCRTLAAEVRRSLNSNEDRLTAYGGLQTLHRFDTVSYTHLFSMFANNLYKIVE